MNIAMVNDWWTRGNCSCCQESSIIIIIMSPQPSQPFPDGYFQTWTERRWAHQYEINCFLPKHEDGPVLNQSFRTKFLERQGKFTTLTCNTAMISANSDSQHHSTKDGVRPPPRGLMAAATTSQTTRLWSKTEADTEEITAWTFDKPIFHTSDDVSTAARQPGSWS